MTGRKLSMLLVAFTILGLLGVGCAPSAAPTATAKAATAPQSPTGQAAVAPSAASPTASAPSLTPKPSGQPKYGGILIASVYLDAPSLDPHQERQFIPLTIAQPVMNGLIEYDPADLNWKIVPALAERWEIGKDGTKIAFYLRKGVNWHDGKPFTSADAKFSLERAGIKPVKGMVAPRSMAFQPVDQIEAPDDYTMVLTLKYPYAEIMDLLAIGFNTMMPKHIVEPLGSAKLKKIEEMVGTGPFKLKSFDSGVGWELIKSDNYFKKGLPYLQGIRYYVIKDESTRFGAFRTKRVMIEGKSPGFSAAQIESIKKSPDAANVVMTDGPVTSVWGIWFNTRHAGPIGDVRVRKAISLAVDRQRVQRLYSANQPSGIIGTMIYPASKFPIPKETIDKMPGFRTPKDADIAEARRLLEEAKLPKDFNLPILVREGALYRDHATITAEELKAIGVNSSLKVVELATWYDVQQKGDFVSSAGPRGTWNPSPHFFFSDWFITGAGSNYDGVSDERIDSLYAKEERTLDSEERKKMFWEMDRILREDIVVGATFYWQTKVTGYWKEVKGYPGLGLGYYEGNRMDDVWLDN